ncbi:hypothetical protein [Streptomyces sp. NPDC004629]|uniref:hypothetical protein n=1 Tax=Streptomyces sp. NPDC004629 TaxID=3364705 RepID=UPI003673647A
MNSRWTDLLAGRLAARGGQMRCVVNQGIGGNRMLADGIGAAALARFDRDILAVPGPGHVVIAVGNDLVFSFRARLPATESRRRPTGLGRPDFELTDDKVWTYSAEVP